MMIGAVDEWRKWALFTVPEGAEWTDGPVALVGDAAHAMLPFAAQGAGMASEDIDGRPASKKVLDHLGRDDLRVRAHLFGHHAVIGGESLTSFGPRIAAR